MPATADRENLAEAARAAPSVRLIGLPASRLSSDCRFPARSSGPRSGLYLTIHLSGLSGIAREPFAAGSHPYPQAGFRRDCAALESFEARFPRRAQPEPDRLA